MAWGGEVLYGERGLAAIDRPMLIIGGTRDERYSGGMTYLLQHAGTTDKALISFVGHDHLMIYRPPVQARIAHFAVAFFGYWLQGREDYKQYFSEEYVLQFEDLAWGVYASRWRFARG